MTTTNTFAPRLPPLTVEQYLQLDRVEPWEIGGWAEIAADTSDSTQWFIGLARDGSLARTDLNLLEYLDYPPQRAERCGYLLNHLPRTWLIGEDGMSTYATIDASHRGKVLDIPPPEAAFPPVREEDQGDQSST